MKKITPFLWFDGKAEVAAAFYTSVFKNSKNYSTMKYAEGAPSPKGSTMSVTIEIEGQEMILFNGGPMFKFSPSVSWFVNCETQEEVDYYWEKLMEGGGAPSYCGWLTDKFGFSWQVIPSNLGRYLQDEDKQKSKRVMEAMMKMGKLDMALLDAAYNGG